MLYVPVLPHDRNSTPIPSRRRASKVSTARASAALDAARRSSNPLDVRRGPEVRLDAPDPERRPRRHQAGQLERPRPRLGPEPAVADVEVDQHVDDHARRRRRLREQLDLPRVADGQQHVGPAPGQRDHPRDLAAVDDRRRQQHAGQPRRDHRLGLGDRRRAHPPRPGRHLHPGDLPALVRLGVRPEVAPLGLGSARPSAATFASSASRSTSSAGVGRSSTVIRFASIATPRNPPAVDPPGWPIYAGIAPAATARVVGRPRPR